MADITLADLQEMERLCKAARPGPWEIHDGGRFGEFGDFGPSICAIAPSGGCQPLFQLCGPADPDVCRANFELIESASPDRMLAIIALAKDGLKHRQSLMYEEGA